MLPSQDFLRLAPKRLARSVFPLKRYRALLKQALHDSVQAACANILCLFIHLPGYLGNAVDGLVGKGELQTFGLNQRLVLLDERSVRFRQNSLEV